MTVAIIPARGGSKRIPRKNIREFAGKPIIAYSIDAALKARKNDQPLFDRVVVSTDCPEIARVAKEFGADVPFVRSADLANDFTGTAEVIRDAIIRLEDEALTAMVCCIYPTSPLLLPSDIERGYRAIIVRDIEQFSFSVARYEMPVERALRVADDGTVSAIYPDHAKTRTQDLPISWRDAAMFYWGRRLGFMERLPLYSKYSVAVPMPTDRICDIDMEEDWLRAERLYTVMTQ